MPANAVKPGEEELWSEAKARAKEQGREGEWAYVMGIFQRMKGEKTSRLDPQTLSFRFLFSNGS
jgi:hypothetical protein